MKQHFLFAEYAALLLPAAGFEIDNKGHSRDQPGNRIEHAEIEKRGRERMNEKYPDYAQQAGSNTAEDKGLYRITHTAEHTG